MKCHSNDFVDSDGYFHEDEYEDFISENWQQAVQDEEAFYYESPTSDE